MRYREACPQRGLYFLAYNAEHRRHSGDVVGTRVASAEKLDLFCLFSAPFFLRESCCLFPALPFLFLVRSDPRLQCIQFVALRDSDIAKVEEPHIALQLLSQTERLALVPVTIYASAFRLAEQVGDTPNVALYVVNVVRQVTPATAQVRNTEYGDGRGNRTYHSRAVPGRGDGMVGGSEQNRPFATLVCAQIMAQDWKSPSFVRWSKASRRQVISIERGTMPE